MPELTPAPVRQPMQPAALAQVADAMSLSLLFSLGRQYLEIPLDQAAHIQSRPPAGEPAESPHFLRVEQVGSPLLGSLHQPFTALQTALAACHDPGHYSLLFVVASDGCTNRLYLGVRGHGATAQPYAFIDYLGQFLEGNWPGTRLARSDHQADVLPNVLYPMSRRMRHAVALTGIPSLKPGDHPGYPQSLDRLLRGLRGRPFIYLIVAEPMAQADVNQAIYRCRDLIGRVHLLAKASLSDTFTNQVSQAEGRSSSTSRSDSSQTSRSTSRSEQMGQGAEAGVSFGIDLLSAVFPPAALLALVAPSFVHGESQSESTTTGQTLTTGSSLSETFTQSLSAAQGIGREALNAHAVAAEQLLEQHIARFEQARTLGCWNVGAYFLAEDPDTAIQGGAQLRALLSGEKSAFEPIRVHDLARTWTSGAYSAQVALSDLVQPPLALVDPRTGQRVEHPLGPAFSGLSTPLNTQELALLVNLPQREVPGVPVMPTADFSLNPPPVIGEGLTLGHLIEGGRPQPLDYTLALDGLAKHALVTGITGSGKSTTCLRLLDELRRRTVPFLVIEPAKDEYMAWAMSINAGLPPDSPERIAVYMPGAQTWQGHKLETTLQLNPLDVVWLNPDCPPQVLSHVDRLKSILNASFPMQESLPILLEDALFYTYGRPVDWLADALPAFDTPRPTLTQLMDHIRPVVKGKGYEERVTANLTAALMTRVQSLRRGWKGQLFDQPRSTSWPDLFDRPAVINLAQLGDDADRAFAMAVLLQFLYEYRQAQRDAGTAVRNSATKLRHLTVVEEAHRILLRSAPGAPEQANPQGKVAELFSNVLSEIRAYGEGFLIVDQVPARLVPDAVKNTNLKIVHRLVAEDDREAMGACMTLTADQTALINRLHPGQAVVYGEQNDMAAWVQVLARGAA